MFRIRAVPRSCNGVAYALAALECACVEDDDPVVAHLPVCIQTIVTAESAVVE